MTKEDLEQELANDTYYEGRREAEMRRDYEAFLDYLEAEIEVAIEAIKDIDTIHQQYGWDMDKRRVLELLKDYI